MDKRLVPDTRQRPEGKSLPQRIASVAGRQSLNSDNERQMLLSHCEAFQNIVSPLEVMASLRAEVRAQRKSKESCWSLDFGSEWNIEAAKPGTGQAIQQRKHLDNTHVNFNNMPRERGNATVDLLGFAHAKQIEADCSSVNEIDVSFDRPRLKPKRTGKGREGEEQLDMSERIRRNAVCEGKGDRRG